MFRSLAMHYILEATFACISVSYIFITNPSARDWHLHQFTPICTFPFAYMVCAIYTFVWQWLQLFESLSDKERTTPTLNLCHGIFTDRSIFRLPFPWKNKGSFGSVTLWRQVCLLWLVIGLLWESRSREIQSKNKSVSENAVTGIWGCCSFLVMGSCFILIVHSKQCVQS